MNKIAPPQIKYLALDLILCLVAALLLAAATPGFDLWFTAFFTFTILIYIHESGRIKLRYAAFITGFIFYLITAYWINIPMTIFGNAPLWGGVILVVLTASVCSLFFWCPFAYTLEKTNSILLSSMVLVALEMLKGKYLFGGLPWLNLALTQHNNPVALSLLPIAGEQAVSFIVLYLGCSFYYVLKKNTDALKVVLYIVIPLLIWTLIDIEPWSNKEDKSNIMIVRLVQTGIKQHDKWDNNKIKQTKEEINSKLYKAVSMPGKYNFMLLPESVFIINPFRYSSTDNNLAFISKNPVIAGYDSKITNAAGDTFYYNAAGLIENGKEVDLYKKIKLAPFGEYFPFENLLYPIRKFFFGTSPLFTPGTDEKIFHINNALVAPLICFESIFSELWKARIDNGANLFVLLSNNAWFGESIGRDQHLATDKLRAAEYGRYLLRSTQDGISAVINPKGKIIKIFDEKIYEVEDVTVYLQDGKTPFYYLNYTWYLVLLIIALIKTANKRKNKQADSPSTKHQQTRIK